MNARGFALLEWLVASAIVLIVAGALFTSIGPVRDLVDRAHQKDDLAPAARTALDLLIADVREAGTNSVVAPLAVDVFQHVPSLELLQDLDAPVPAQLAGAIRVARVPALAPQGRLRLGADAGENLLRLDTASRCATGEPACGFRPGDRAVLATAVSAEFVVVSIALDDAVVLEAGIARAFPADASLCRIITTTYGRRQGAGAADRLVRVTDGGAEQPLIDNLVAFELVADDPDALRIRRISVRLRVQVGAAEFRGPAGYLFVRPGTATTSRRWLPDLELRSDIAIRPRRSAP